MAIIKIYEIYGYEVEVCPRYDDEYKNGQEPEFYDLFANGQCLNQGSPIYPGELDDEDAVEGELENGRKIPSESFVRREYSDLLLEWLLTETEGASLDELRQEHAVVLDKVHDLYITKIRNGEVKDDAVQPFFELYHAVTAELPL